MKHAKKSSFPQKLLRLTVFLLILGGSFFLVQLFGGALFGRYDQNAVKGSADKSAERTRELQNMADRSMITMSINATPVWRLSEKDAGVNWQIENPEEQSTKLIRVEIIRNDTGEKLYTTGTIPPGSYISGTMPDVELDVGTYVCTAYFYSYDIETEELLGMAGAQITLYVQT